MMIFRKKVKIKLSLPKLNNILIKRLVKFVLWKKLFFFEREHTARTTEVYLYPGRNLDRDPQSNVTETCMSAQ